MMQENLAEMALQPRVADLFSMSLEDQTTYINRVMAFDKEVTAYVNRTR